MKTFLSGFSGDTHRAGYRSGSMSPWILSGLILAVLLAVSAGSAVADSATSGTLTRVTPYVTNGVTLRQWNIVPDANGALVARLNDVGGTAHRLAITTEAAMVPASVVTLKDRDAVDLLGGRGTVASTTTLVSLPCYIDDGATSSGLPVPIAGDLDLSLSGASTGTVRLYMKP